MPMITRRSLLKAGAAGLCGTAVSGIPGAAGLVGGIRNAYALDVSPNLSSVEALYYEKKPHKEVVCTLCPRKCKVGDMERGYCGVRENRGGIYYTLVHSRPCAVHADPIEKKPLFHFLPGSRAFSIATAGCNLNCKCCQNWNISQARPEQTSNYTLPPERVVDLAKNKGCASIAYTYTEPIVYYEYMRDCAAAGKPRGIRSVMISAGYINPEPLEALCGRLDAIKIDLKGFRPDVFEDLCSGDLAPVLETLKILARKGVWTEIVYLVIPSINDNPKDIEAMCAWILRELGPDVPIHFTRFHPQYLLKNLPATPVSTIERFHGIARKAGIRYVYVGNIPGHRGESTYCHACGERIIGRFGFRITENNLAAGRCRFCNAAIPGVWS